MRRRSLAAFVALVLVVGACGDDGEDPPPSSAGGDLRSEQVDPGPIEVLVLSDPGAGLVAHRIARATGGHTGASGGQRTFQLTDVETAPVTFEAGPGDIDPDEGDAGGVAGQACFLDERTFVMADADGSAQAAPTIGVYALRGDTVADLSATRTDTLTPPAPSGGLAPYGCARLEDGRLVTTELDPAAPGTGTGRVLLWFPPLDSGEVAACVLDDGIAAPGQATAEDGAVVVASAAPPTAGMWRYTDLPTGPTAEEGCGATPERLIPAGGEGLPTATGVAAGPGGAWYVSNATAGTIGEFDASGTFVGPVLTPSDEGGDPTGLVVGPDGRLYYADATGSVRRIDLTGARPGPPEAVADDLEAPSAVSLYVPGVTGSTAPGGAE